MIKKRSQLTLFIDEKDSQSIEEIRQKFNSEQYALIKSHVTLCREDELEDLDKILQTIAETNNNCISIDFGQVERFADGKGVLIPAIGDNIQFHELRKNILTNLFQNPRKHAPHITLMHPRNSTCNDEIFEQLKTIKFPDKLTFNKISLIKQEDGNHWKVVKEFELKPYSI